MSKLTEAILNIELLERKKADLEKEIEQVSSNIVEHTRRAREEILNGATTKDPVRDLVIRTHGVDLETERRYRALQEKLVGKKGEFVMIRYPVKVRERFGDELRSSDMRQETHFRIGTLSGEELKLDERKSAVTLPSDQYLQGVWPQSRTYTIYAEEKPKQGDFFEYGFESDPFQLIQYISDEHHASNLIVGDDAVRRALGEVNDKVFFAVAAQRLNRLVLETT